MDALRGIWLIFRTPRLWGMCLGPLALSIVAYTVLGALGGIFLFPHLSEWLARVPGSAWLTAIAGGAAILVYLVLFPFLFVLFGGIFFGVVFESLSLAIERIVRPDATPPTHAPSMGVSVRDTLSRLFLNVTLGIVALILSPFLGPIPGIIAAGIIGLLDYTAPAYLRRGKVLSQQTRRLLAPPDARTLSFGLVAGLLSLVPVLGVLILPGLVAGGTLLTLERETT